MKTIIVTGGAGFIGCNFVRTLLDETPHKVVVIDKLTYAGSLYNLEDVSDKSRLSFEQVDIADGPAVKKVFETYRPTSIVNFAAESHVDRSIDSPADFVHTNVVGTFILLENALAFYRDLKDAEKKDFRFLHVSTDEVYGTLGKTGLFSEETPYAPNSPYSASKAGADHLVRAYFETYGLPALITNCSNNYGPFQFPEKLIPLVILNAYEGKELPIYGDGANIRDWLYVEDHCKGIELALKKGKLGEKYNIGGNNEKTNLEVVDTICEVLEELKPAAKNEKLKAKGVSDYKSLKTFVKDRPGHDKRYAIDAQKITNELGWKAVHNFKTGLKHTVQWYLNNADWSQNVQSGNYDRERLGLKESGRKV